MAFFCKRASCSRVSSIVNVMVVSLLSERWSKQGRLPDRPNARPIVPAEGEDDHDGKQQEEKTVDIHSVSSPLRSLGNDPLPLLQKAWAWFSFLMRIALHPLLILFKLL